MFNKPMPQLLAHSAVLEQGNFVLHDYILNQNSGVNLFHRYCPHRMYPLHEPAQHIEAVHCHFHNFNWDRNGQALDNNKKLVCGQAEVGRSGLIFKNFQEPDAAWITDLSLETDLHYSHATQGSSTGSWMWLMDAEADLLHVYRNGIHPFLAEQIDVEQLVLDQGPGWIYQQHPDGWWVYVFPFCFIEYGRPGKLAVNRVIPKNPDSEYGFDWMTQFYYAPGIHPNDRMIFETMDQVFREDIAAAELQKGNYFPLMKAMNRYENHCVHFGQWYREHANKK